MIDPLINNMENNQETKVRFDKKLIRTKVSEELYKKIEQVVIDSDVDLDIMKITYSATENWYGIELNEFLCLDIDELKQLSDYFDNVYVSFYRRSIMVRYVTKD